MKYLMTWMGVSQSSGMGCDNGGYPERKTRIIESLDSLVESYRKDADYYKLEPVDVTGVVQAVKDFE